MLYYSWKASRVNKSLYLLSTAVGRQKHRKVKPLTSSRYQACYSHRHCVVSHPLTISGTIQIWHRLKNMASPKLSWFILLRPYRSFSNVKISSQATRLTHKPHTSVPSLWYRLTKVCHLKGRRKSCTVFFIPPPLHLFCHLSGNLQPTKCSSESLFAGKIHRQSIGELCVTNYIICLSEGAIRQPCRHKALLRYVCKSCKRIKNTSDEI